MNQNFYPAYLMESFPTVLGSPVNVEGARMREDWAMKTPWLICSAALLICYANGVLAQQVPPTPTKAERMEAALRDLKAGRGLPGLPNLKKPVYVTKDSLICRSPGALANPNVAVLLMTGACIVPERRIRVTVYPPRDSEEYINDYLFNMVAVGWRSDEISNGNIFSGWVKIDELGN